MQNVTSLQNKYEKNYADVAVIIKNDFIDSAVSLEKETIKFFNKNIHNMKTSPRDEHQKYKKEETLNRLQNTILHKNWIGIEEIK